MADEIDLQMCNFRNFRSPVTLTLTLDRVIRHTIMHQSSTSIYTPNFIEIGKSFVDGCTDVPTGHFRLPLMLLGRLGDGKMFQFRRLSSQKFTVGMIAVKILPSSFQAPSTWYAAVAVPHIKSFGKLP